MIGRLLVADGACRAPAEGARLVGAAASGVVLVLGAVPPASAGAANAADADADADAAETPPPPFAFSLEEMLPHGLSVVGCVCSNGGGEGSASPCSSPWVTLDPSTGAFYVGEGGGGRGSAVTPTFLPLVQRSSSSGLRPLSLPPNDAFALVRASMPVMAVDELEALLGGEDGGNERSSPLLFACGGGAAAGGGGGSGLVLSAAAPPLDSAAGSPPATTAAQLNGATFVPLVDTTPSAAGEAAAAPVFEYEHDGCDGGGGAAATAATAPPQQQQQRQPPPLLVHLDALAVVPSSAPAHRFAHDHLAPALRAQLRLGKRVAAAAAAAPEKQAQQQQQRQQQQEEEERRVVPRAAHFLPPPPWSLGFPVTLLYPLPPLPQQPPPPPQQQQQQKAAAAAEARLSGVRRAAHAALGLPMDRPLLRLANAAAFAGSAALALPAAAPPPEAAAMTYHPKQQHQKKLVNVHAALPSSPLGPLSGRPRVTTALVEGDYEYCHYLQDGARDAGWGCAYRSLQTLCSWLRLQGLCPVDAGAGADAGAAKWTNPTHAEIQRALVRLGDKPASFIGSSQWIGAVEVGYVLDELCGVQSRVLTAPRGDAVPGLARRLAAHFTENGSPVMVGGGVLAYTLLGVQLDEDTGDAAFLILDPHYGGGDSEEELRGKIVAGGWVAWKRAGDKAAAGGELFVADAFYNFLCPMRPREV